MDEQQASDPHQMRRERVYDLFSRLRSFPRERMDWIDWLWWMYRYLSIVFDSVTPEHVPDPEPAARALLLLLYSDARGASPWGDSKWENFLTLPSSTPPKLELLERLVKTLEGNGELHEVLHAINVHVARIAGVVEAFEAAGITVRLAGVADALNEVIAKTAPAPKADPLVHATSAARFVGNEPHAWEKQPPLRNGSPHYYCPRCERSTFPNADKLAEFLATNDCPGKVRS